MELAELLGMMPPEVADRLKTGGLKPLSSDDCLRQRMEWENAIPGSLTGYDCPDCKNRGYNTEIRDGYLVSVPCKCMATRRSIRNLEKSGMKELVDRHTLENFQEKQSWQSAMKQRAVDYLEHGGGRWFSALGSVGAGKTHICTAICGELLKRGKEVRYMLWRDMSVKLKAAVNEADEYDRLIWPLKRARVLYIDDLFKTERNGKISQADINLAFELLNYRYCGKKLITVISSERTMNELLDIDEAIGSRISERCGPEYCVELEGKKNWRMG